MWLTCSLDKPGVSIVWDDGNRQIPEVQFQCTCDDIDVFIGADWDICLLAICEDVRWNKEDKKKKIVTLQKREKNLLSLIRLACFVLTSSQLCMLSTAGHGLLVLADWTSQCCELEWHSVMDDLPHADLAKSLAHCCRVFLTVKIHTALGQDRLILTKSSIESQHSRRIFFYSYVQGSECTSMVCIPRSPCACPHMKPSVSGTCQSRICSSRWTLILHKFATFSSIWYVPCVLCKCVQTFTVDRHIVIWQKSIKSTRRKTDLCRTPSWLLQLNHWIQILCRGLQTLVLEEQTWNKQPFRHCHGCHEWYRKIQLHISPWVI